MSAAFASAGAAQTLSLPNGSVYRAGPDFATDVLQDSWDFGNPEDISPDPDQVINWTAPDPVTVRTIGNGPAFITGGWFRGVPGFDSHLALITRADALAVSAGRTGARYPIDTARYRKLAVKMRVTGAPGPGHAAAFWFHASTAEPNWGNRGGSAHLLPVVPGGTSEQVYVLDLAQASPVNPPGAAYLAEALVKGLRFDPPDGAASLVEVDWVRLTASNTAGEAALMPVNLAGCSAFQSLTVTDAAGVPAVITDSTGTDSSRVFNHGIFPPGTYNIRATCGNGSTPAPGPSFTINTPPVVTVTDPDETGDPATDYALLARGGDRWDFEQLTDVARTLNVGIAGGGCGTPGPCGIVPTARPGGTGNMLRASPVGSTNQQLGDPGLEMLDGAIVPLNSRRHRLLTFSLRNNRPYELTSLVGPVLRVLWSSVASGDGLSMTMTQDMRVWPGMHTYTIDMGALSTANGGIETECATCPTIPWMTRGIRHLRLDPHEYGDVPTTFDLDDMTLTAPDEVRFGQTFTVHYGFTDPDAGGSTYTARLFREDWITRTGRTLVANLGTVVPGALSYVLDPLAAGMAPGAYALSVEVTETRAGVVQTSRAYATGMLAVSDPGASTPRITVATPAANQNLPVPFTIQGCAYDDGRTTGGINVDDVSVRMRDVSGSRPTLVLGFESAYPGTGALQFGPLGTPVACAGASGPYAQSGFRVTNIGAGTGNYFHGSWMLDVFARSTISGEYVQLSEIPITIGPVPPAGPTNFQASSAGNTVTVSWQAPGPGIAYYQIQGAATPSLNPIAFRLDVPGTGPYSGELASGTYYLRVYGRTTSGAWTSPSAMQVVNVALPAPPGAPTLMPAQVSSNPVTLTWSPGPGGAPASYTVHAGTGPGLSNLAVAPLGGGTSMTATAPVGVPIYVRVVAANAAGSATSNEVVFTLRPPSAPALSPAAVAGRNVTLQWSAAAGATSYTVLARVPGSSAIVAALPTGTTSVTVPAPPGTYLVTVVANNGLGSSGESNQISVVVVP